MESSGKSSRAINELPRPRVLVYGIDDEDFLAALQERVETVESASYLSRYSMDEWDCVVTASGFTSMSSKEEVVNYRTGETRTTHRWSQDFPEHISVVYFSSTDVGYSNDFVDFLPPEGESADLPNAAILVNRGINGRHLTYADVLPDYISELVKETLVPAVKSRERHLVFSTVAAEGMDDRIELRPFLYGPQGNVLAGSYVRSGGKGSIWILPNDLINKVDWVLAAFKEWHGLYSDRFPVDSSWQSGERWQSAMEERIRRELAAAEEELRRAFEAYAEVKQNLESQLTKASLEAEGYERALLSSQDERFQGAVLRALVDLGFAVQDMDEIWPEDARREDYRITDPEAGEWMCIAEAKGFTKGVAETGIAGLQRCVEAYLVETSGSLPSSRWYIVNHFINRDPARRQKILSGRSDVIEVFAASNGLVVEGRALFELIRFVETHPDRKLEIRAQMRSMTGVFEAAAAMELIDKLTAIGE